jgi:cell division septum initiation protein DivIVA
MLNSTENFNHFNDMVLDRIEQILKSVKVTSKRDLNWPIESLEHAVEESNQFFKIAGFPTIELPSSLMEVMKDHLQFRLKRYEELNTPEMIAKLEVEKKKREEQKQKKQIESLKQDIENWRNFTFSSLHSLRNLPFALLRVRGSEVETSAGAQVSTFPRS